MMSSQIRNIVIIDLPTVDLWRSAALFPCAKRSRVACESECRWSVRVDTYALRAKNKALLEMRTLIIMQENKVECSRLIEPKKLPLAYRYQQTRLSGTLTTTLLLHDSSIESVSDASFDPSTLIVVGNDFQDLSTTTHHSSLQATMVVEFVISFLK